MALAISFIVATIVISWLFAKEHSSIKEHCVAMSDRFEIYKARGNWYWTLQRAHSPWGPIARCARGYASKEVAIKSVKSAMRAMRGSRGRIKFLN